MPTATAPTRTPDAEINPREVIRANWDSETPDTEPWSIVTTDKNGNETVHHEGHDLGLALRNGWHREAQRLHEDAAKADTAEKDDAERAEFEAWKAQRDARERAEFEAQRGDGGSSSQAAPPAPPQWQDAG